MAAGDVAEGGHQGDEGDGERENDVQRVVGALALPGPGTAALLPTKTRTAVPTNTTRWLDPSHGGLSLGFPQNA